MTNYLNRCNDNDLFNGESFLDALFNDFNGKSTYRLMRTDIKENDKEYLLDIELPGYEKNDIKISYENEYLTVKASKVEKDEKHTHKFLHKERYYGSYTRSYYVGKIEQDLISAAFTNGILTITLPKEDIKKQEEKKYISIQ